MSESKISLEADDLSENIAQVLAESPRHESKSQRDEAMAKGKPTRTAEQEDALLAEIAGGFT